jgi:Nif-specific regulatory protein
MSAARKAGRYEFLETLGEGGSGAVYRVLDTAEGREVAMKVLRDQDDAPAPRLAGEEFRLLSSHSHPHLVQVFDYGTLPSGESFFTMELCRGDDLMTYVRRLAPPPELPQDPRFVEVLRQLLAAVDYIHARGLVHQDLKPENVIVSEREGKPAVKLIDFGLARQDRWNGAALSGTVEYIAPERIRGERGTSRSDLYSLGAMLYEVFCGEPPFSGPSAGDVVRGHLERKPDDLGSLPEPFRAVTSRLLEKSPLERPASAKDVLEALWPGAAAAESWRPAFSAVFVGRDELVSRLLGALAGSHSGPPGRTILLSGATGMGKSRLLRELKVELQLQGTRVEMESCLEEALRPGALLERLLGRIGAGLQPGGPAHEKLQAIISELTECDTPGAPAGELLLDGLFHRLSSLLLELAQERRLVIAIDDLQWADGLSLEALRAVKRRIEHTADCRLSLLLACRQETESDSALIETIEGDSRGLSRFESLPLPPLDESDIRRYLERLLGGADSFPEELPRRLRAETAGNPFFLEEYLKLLIEIGGAARKGTGWRVDAAIEVAVPGSLEEAAARRLIGLDDEKRLLIECLAVLAEPATPAALSSYAAEVSAGANKSPEKVERELSAAARDGLLVRDGSCYSFAHSALARAAYGSIPAEARRLLHGLAADWLLRREGSGGSALESIARHLYLSEEPQRGRELLRRAGERARRAGALREAALHFSRALEVTPEPRERFEVLLGREEVLGHLGRKEEQLADIRELGRIAAGAGELDWRLDAMLREALYLDSLGEKRRGLALLEDALALAAGGSSLQARLLSRSGMLRLFLSEFEPGLAKLDEALALARQRSDREQEAECLQLIGLGHYLQGNYDRALVEMEKAFALRRELGDEQRAGSLESNLGLILYDRGLLEAAEERFQSSLKTFRRIGLRRGEAVNLVNLGLVYSDMGRLERALDFISEALQVRRELGDRHGEGADLGNLAAVWLRVGRHERAAPLCEEALAIARQFENRQSESVNECRMGIVHLRRGEEEKALASFERALDGAGGRFQRLLALTSLARLQLQRKQPETSLEHVEEALETALKGRMRSWAIECRALRAAALLALGRCQEADLASREAVEELDRFPGWLERSHEVLFIRHRVLAAASGREEEAEEALRRAYTLLREKADAFVDPELRAAFLESIPLHRDIDRLHDEMQRQIRRESTRRERSFYEISKSLHSILEIDPLLDHLLALAIESTHAEKGLILLRDAGGKLTIRAARGMARESVEDAAEICQSVIADVARGGEPVLATDASSDDRFRERRSIISFQIRTLMCVPLKVRDVIVGAVYVDGRGAASFSKEDLEYLVSFAQLAAIAVDNAHLLGRLRAENLQLRREVEARFRFENLIGRGPAMEELMRLMEKVARTSAGVLISGETGTGKAVIARAIHYASERRGRPFVTVDCGALPETLLESELFGHKRGAFSGAIHDRVGLIEEAEGGTLFLDEIANTSLDLQAKLLRVLQEGEIRRVGENQMRKVDVRILAATNVPLREAVEKGAFREDLFYRLNVVPLEVPPLRERSEDIPLLAAHFLEKSRARLGKSVSGFSDEAMRLLERAPWRGNVRELENTVEKAVILAESELIDAAFLAAILPPGDDGAARGAELGRRPENGGQEPMPERAPFLPEPPAGLELAEFDRLWSRAEKEFLQALVERAGWNLTAAARLAGVKNRNTLIARLKRHGIERD